MRRIRSLVAVAAATTVLGAVLTAPTADAAPAWLDHLRDATRPYKDLSVAKADGYGKFKDADGIACIDNPPDGGMGVHFVNGDLVGDGEVLKDHPEALVYDPTPNGMKLVALEYIVFRKAWRADHPTGRPELYGQKFEPIGADNRYGIPPFFELHVWAWKANSSGLFNDWNPKVTCP
jgi:hypothetical protein